jgi:hypothetical protein
MSIPQILIKDVPKGKHFDFSLRKGAGMDYDWRKRRRHMKLLSWSAAIAWSLVSGGSVLGQEGGSTNAPAPAADTQAVAAASAPVTASAPAASEGWVGFVRVLKDPKGDVRAVRLVTGDSLLAVDMNEKGLELGKTPKTRKMLVMGALEERDGRSWLVVSEFKTAPETVPAPVPAPAQAPAPAPAPETSGTNVTAAVTNAPAP